MEFVGIIFGNACTVTETPWNLWNIHFEISLSTISGILVRIGLLISCVSDKKLIFRPELMNLYSIVWADCSKITLFCLLRIIIKDQILIRWSNTMGNLNVYVFLILVSAVC